MLVMTWRRHMSMLCWAIISLLLVWHPSIARRFFFQHVLTRKLEYRLKDFRRFVGEVAAAHESSQAHAGLAPPVNVLAVAVDLVAAHLRVWARLILPARHTASATLPRLLLLMLVDCVLQMSLCWSTL